MLLSFSEFVDRTTDYWTAVSPRSDLPHSNLTLLVNYVWNDSMAHSSVVNMSAGDVQFSYRPDPNVTRVYPLQHLYTYAPGVSQFNSFTFSFVSYSTVLFSGIGSVELSNCDGGRPTGRWVVMTSLSDDERSK